MDSRKEYELLLKRFRHLLKSDVIRLYDEVDPRTGKYKRDIKDLDRRYREADGCTPLIIYIPDIFIKEGYTDQLKEFVSGVVEDAIKGKRNLGCK